MRIRFVNSRRAPCSKKAVLFVCWWLLALLAPAQAQYRFDHWTADNGLPQNSVRDIVQTRDGYLWMTTFDGLVRFDGVRFTVFNKSNSPGLVSNRFTFLYEDKQGDLWIKGENLELVRRQQGRFTTFTKAQGLPNLNSDFIGGMARGIWWYSAAIKRIAGRGKHLSYFQTKTLRRCVMKQLQRLTCANICPHSIMAQSGCST